MDTNIIEFAKLAQRVAVDIFVRDCAAASDITSELFADKFGCNVVVGTLNDVGRSATGSVIVSFEATCCGVEFDVGYEQFVHGGRELFVAERLASRCGFRVHNAAELYDAIIAANPGIVAAAKLDALPGTSNSSRSLLEETFSWMN